MIKRSAELVANLFRITQAEEKLVNEKIQGECDAKTAHYEIGKIIREAIKKTGGTMPENLPKSKRSLKELEKEKRD